MARERVTPPYREGGLSKHIKRQPPEITRDNQINDLIDYLRLNIDMDSLASFIGMSRRTLTRYFSKATWMTLSDWPGAECIQPGHELLETTDHSIEAIAPLSKFQSRIPSDKVLSPVVILVPGNGD